MSIERGPDADVDRRGTGTPARPTWLPPAIVGTEALREPQTDLAARQEARRQAGLDVDGLGYPRSHLWVVAVLPGTVISLLLLIALILGGPPLLGVAAVAAAAAAGGSAGYLLRDPLRVSSAERRALVADRAWHSDQPWIGALATTPERLLVSAAQEAVVRLVRAPAWSTAAFDEHRLRLDLKAELDEVDRQAYDLATARSRLGGQPHEAHAAASAALGRRVDALVAYADAVAALGGRAEPPDASDHERQLETALVATVRDEFATERLFLLRAELPQTPAAFTAQPEPLPARSDRP